MVFKKLLFLSLLSFLLSSHLVADQLYGGLGFNIAPGESSTQVSRIPITVVYETTGLWRFSYTDTDFKNSSDLRQKSIILGAEKMWVKKVKKGFTLIGAFGSGYYSTTYSGEGSGAGTTIGMLATGSVRWAMTESLFIQASFQYKNAAVTIEGGSVNAGYQGLFVSYGMFF